MEILHPGVLVCQAGQLVKVGSKQAQSSDFGANMLRDCPRKTETIVPAETANMRVPLRVQRLMQTVGSNARRRAPTELVNNDERVFGSCLQNGRRLEHLSHECGNPLKLRISGPNTRENGIHDGDGGRITRDKASDLSHQDINSNLPDVGRFASHIWTSDD